jgi:hypothetical protein
MARRAVTIGAFILGGLVVALALAFFVSPRASSSPDGLERVAEDKGFLETADDSAVADGPLADYSTKGIDDVSLSTGVAGIIGVLVTFVVGLALFAGMKLLSARKAAMVGSPDGTGVT